MAIALPELLGLLGELLEEVRGLSFLSKIMRAFSFFEDVSKVRKIKKAILEYKDVKQLVLKSKKVKDYVLNQLFALQLKSNNFVFFSEQDLINYVRSKDPNAKILKLAEFKEVSLYLVEGCVFSKKWVGLLNCFTFALLISQFNEFNNNVLNEILGAYNDLYSELERMKDDIIAKLRQEKQEDVNNTYCLRCSCCCSCSCDKGSCSCCCSCSCNLVHYVQSWDNLEGFILNRFKEYEIYLKNRMLEDEENSLKAKFILLFDLLMKFLFLKAKEKYLFAVVKEKEILKEFEKDKKKTGVMKEIYEFLQECKGKKLEYNKFIKELQEYLYRELNRKYTKHQVEVLYNTVIKMYHFRKIKIKKDKKTYLVIL